MRRVVAAVAGLGALLVAAGAAAQTFTDVTKTSGLQALRDMKPADIWLSGTHLLDLDGDGDLDFFFGSHGGFHGIVGVNDGSGRFTPASLPMAASSEMHMIYDLDENGVPDVTFTEGDGVTRWFLATSTPGVPGFKSTPWVQSYSRNGVMADIDGDGNVDWVVGGGQGGTGNPEAVWLYFGDGKGAFRKDVQAIVIPNVDRDTARPIAVDLDADGDLDLVVEWKDLGAGNRPRIYRNDGAAGGKVTLTPATAAMGLAETDGLATIGIGDIDQDGDTDIVARDKGLFAYLNDGRGHFTRKDGLVSGEQPKGGDLMIASVTDLDNDGVADLVVGGFQTLYLLRGLGGGTFSVMNSAWGIAAADPNGSRVCFAFGDIDGDGDLDLVGPRGVLPKMQYNVYRNDLPAKSWLNVRPVGLAGHKGAMGALISITEPGTDKLLWFEEVAHHGPQIMQNTYGYAETERHFGLGARTTVDVSVLFRPSNKLVTKKGVAANTTVRIGEDGTGVVVPPTNRPSSPMDAGTASDAGAGPTTDAIVPVADATGAAGTPATSGGAGAPPTGSAGTGPTGAGGGPAGTSGGAAGAPGETGGATAGCACALGTAGETPAGALGLLVSLGLVAWVRRRRRANPN